jgi:N-acetylmuramoyl-L-alanine amidase CwlA
MAILFFILLLFILITLSVLIINSLYYAIRGNSESKNNSILHNLQGRLLGYNNDGIETIDQTLLAGLEIKEDFLTPNEYSRPQTPLKGIEGVVIHYTANPGTTAANNRSYFENLATTHTTSASSHFIVGLEGEVIQCIPLTEISYASNNRNADTVAIECCIPDETGKFNDATYASTVALTAAICVQFDLDEEDIIRHYDVTGKCCPKYFVEHEDAWRGFKEDVMQVIRGRK